MPWVPTVAVKPCHLRPLLILLHCRPHCQNSCHYFSLPSPSLHLSTIILCWLDLWAGLCWRFFPPRLTIFRWTSAIWHLCTELPKRYKYHTHTYSNDTSLVVQLFKCSLNHHYKVFMQNTERTCCDSQLKWFDSKHQLYRSTPSLNLKRKVFIYIV